MENNKAIAYTTAKNSTGCKAPRDETDLVFIIIGFSFSDRRIYVFKYN
jgi:hypothetical protein